MVRREEFESLTLSTSMRCSITEPTTHTDFKILNMVKQRIVVREYLFNPTYKPKLPSMNRTSGSMSIPKRSLILDCSIATVSTASLYVAPPRLVIILA